MNREIKFRAWDRTLKEFLPNVQNHINDIEWAFGSMLKNERFFIQQYTGLKDKNGKEIYEGDILREPPKNEWEKINFSCYEVFFHDGDANMDYNIGYSIARSHYHGSICGGYIPSFKPKTVSKMEIIGNIYENHELLK